MRVGVCGLGLIGGSVVQGLADTVHEVFAFDPDPAVLASAERWAVPVASAEDLRDCDLVVAAVPFDRLDEVLSLFTEDVFSGIVTDTGSVKEAPLRTMRGRARYVGSHPMAGKEVAGWDSAEPGLFRDRPWVVGLEEDTPLDDWEAVARVAVDLGARVVPVDAAAHDAAVARVSHVEHLLAAAVMHLVKDDPLALSLGAGSFRDATRVAASSPQLFDGMVRGNMKHLSGALGGVANGLGSIAGMLFDDMTAYTGRLTGWFTEAHEARSAWPPEPGEGERMDLSFEALRELGIQGGWVEAIEGKKVAAVRRPRIKSTYE
ncbi:prephenate dehydrogenase [Salininema proteolyticum]|uniref:Prephenate dehydrogenase n=1 Tax=Salininema proteolyticum TaxID=1607685 RepID=A0ABV8TXC2_9ACTN